MANVCQQFEVTLIISRIKYSLMEDESSPQLISFTVFCHGLWN